MSKVLLINLDSDSNDTTQLAVSDTVSDTDSDTDIYYNDSDDTEIYFTDNESNNQLLVDKHKPDSDLEIVDNESDNENTIHSDSEESVERDVSKTPKLLKDIEIIENEEKNDFNSEYLNINYFNDNAIDCNHEEDDENYNINQYFIDINDDIDRELLESKSNSNEEIVEKEIFGNNCESDEEEFPQNMMTPIVDHDFDIKVLQFIRSIRYGKT